MIEHNELKNVTTQQTIKQYRQNTKPKYRAKNDFVGGGIDKQTLYLIATSIPLFAAVIV